jgi:hypothetical protein
MFGDGLKPPTNKGAKTVISVDMCATERSLGKNKAFILA